MVHSVACCGLNCVCHGKEAVPSQDSWYPKTVFFFPHFGPISCITYILSLLQMKRFPFNLWQKGWADNLKVWNNGYMRWLFNLNILVQSSDINYLNILGLLMFKLLMPKWTFLTPKKLLCRTSATVLTYCPHLRSICSAVNGRDSFASSEAQ